MDRVLLDPALSTAKWNKEKGIIAKLKTKTNETGITAALTAMETAYNAIKWADIEAKGLQNYASEDAVKEQMKKVAGEILKMSKLIETLKAVHKQADDAFPLFKNSRVIPKSSSLFVDALRFHSNTMIGDIEKAKKTATAELGQLNEWAKGKAHGF